MADMGRRPTKNFNLPPRMRARIRGSTTWYYYDAGGKPRKEIPLGNVYTAAVQKWIALEGKSATSTGSTFTFKDAADRYLVEVIPTKAARTQQDNIKELNKLLEFFNSPPALLEAIKPIHIRKYLDWRGTQAKIRANREKALFSHIWNKARDWGLTDQPNPCAGIKGFTEQGRNIYIEDDVLEAVWQAGDQALRDAMDLAYLTGQRPADVLNMSEMNIQNGTLTIEQGKTRKKLRIEVTGALATLVERIKARKQGYKVHTLALICSEIGRPVTSNMLRKRFEAARDSAAKTTPKLKDAIKAFQFRDLRAKAGTDKADSAGIQQAQAQLGHTSVVMTEHYVRDRRGDRVSPTK